MSEELVGAAALTCRYVVALVLLAAAIPKLGDRGEFARAVRNYGLQPISFVRPVAVWLPRLELACAVALLLGVAVAIVSAAAGTLLLAFAVAMSVNLARGRQIDCGCSGSVAPRRIGWWLVAGDILLAGMSAAVALADPGVLAIVGTETSTTLTAEDGMAIAMFAVVLVPSYLVASSWLVVRRQAAR